MIIAVINTFKLAMILSTLNGAVNISSFFEQPCRQTSHGCGRQNHWNWVKNYPLHYCNLKGQW